MACVSSLLSTPCLCSEAFSSDETVVDEKIKNKAVISTDWMSKVFRLILDPPLFLSVGARVPTQTTSLSDLPAGRQVPPHPALALAKPEARFHNPLRLLVGRQALLARWVSMHTSLKVKVYSQGDQVSKVL
jgi:hypothetical protein